MFVTETTGDPEIEAIHREVRAQAWAEMPRIFRVPSYNGVSPIWGVSAETSALLLSTRG